MGTDQFEKQGVVLLAQSDGCAVWQFPAEDKHRVQLFAHCIKNHVFHELRTVRQMGYVVWSFFSSIEGNCAFVVILQSNSVGPVSCTDA